MKKNWNFYRFGIIIAFLQCFHLSAFAQANIDGISKDVAIDQTIEERSRSYSLYGSYMLGPGDTVGVELLDIPEYSGVATIGPDGTIYLPRLRSIYVEGYTIEELQEKLTELYTNTLLILRFMLIPLPIGLLESMLWRSSTTWILLSDRPARYN